MWKTLLIGSLMGCLSAIAVLALSPDLDSARAPVATACLIGAMWCPTITTMLILKRTTIRE